MNSHRYLLSGLWQRPHLFQNNLKMYSLVSFIKKYPLRLSEKIFLHIHVKQYLHFLMKVVNEDRLTESFTRKV